MLALNSQNLLHSIVKLTERPDVLAFEEALATTLREMVAAKKVKFGKILESRPGHYGKVVVYTPDSKVDSLPNEDYETALIEHDDALVECLKTEQKVVTRLDPGPGSRVIHPLRLNTGIIGFVTLEFGSDIPGDQDIVHGLLGFYKNYVSLLDENQRDKLTGLLNRKTFDEKILRMISGKRAQRDRDNHEGDRRYCLAIIDIDHFKRINDAFGHLYGDEVLLLFAQAMAGAFHGEDLLFRIGGEEFVVVLGDADLKTALDVFDQFRANIAARSFPGVGSLTISIGVTVICGDDLPTTILGRADQALYFAKDNGRNQVCIHESLVAEGKLSNMKKDEGTVELFH